MTTIAEKAKAIRTELKKKYGWTSKQVSVRSKSYSLGASIRVTIKDLKVSKKKVSEIALQHRDFYYCQYSQEILSVGNHFVFVEIDDYEVKKAGKEFSERCPQITKRLNEMGEGWENSINLTDDFSVLREYGNIYQVTWFDGKFETTKCYAYGVEGVLVAFKYGNIWARS